MKLSKARIACTLMESFMKTAYITYLYKPTMLVALPVIPGYWLACLHWTKLQANWGRILRRRHLCIVIRYLE